MNRFAAYENWIKNLDMNNAWERIRENTKTSA
jgi:hypothetical protein